jgi:hypothetical protein
MQSDGRAKLRQNRSINTKRITNEQTHKHESGPGRAAKRRWLKVRTNKKRVRVEMGTLNGVNTFSNCNLCIPHWFLSLLIANGNLLFQT